MSAVNNSRPTFLDVDGGFLKKSVQHLNDLVNCIASNTIQDQISKEESQSRLALSVILELAGYTSALATAGLLGYTCFWAQNLDSLKWTGLAFTGAVASFAGKYFLFERPSQFDRMRQVWDKVVCGFIEENGPMIVEGVEDVVMATREHTKDFYATVKGMSEDHFKNALHHVLALGYMTSAANVAEKEEIDFDELEKGIKNAKKHLLKAGIEPSDPSLNLYEKSFTELIQASIAAKAAEAAKEQEPAPTIEAAPAA